MADWRKIAHVTGYSIAATATLAFGLWYYFGDGGVRDTNALRATYAQQQVAISERELQKQELATYLAAVQRGDEQAMELAARRYGLVGENEFLWKVITVPEDTMIVER